MSPTVRALMIACLAGALASACDDPPPPAPAAGKPAAAKPAAAQALVPPNMVTAVSASKTASLIGMHFALESAPTLGQPLAVNMAIIPHREFESLKILFETPASVILATGERFEAPGKVKPEAVFSHKLVVQPTQEGVYLITAAVETASDEGTVIRIYSIPVIVYGKPAADKPPADKPAAG